MGKKLYVGNLSYGVTDSNLERKCSQPTARVDVGAQVIMGPGHRPGPSGFGFVEMSTDQEAQAAIPGSSMGGTDSGGRALTVNEAKPAR